MISHQKTRSTRHSGSLEVGRPEPHYGPRWLKTQPFYR